MKEKKEDYEYREGNCNAELAKSVLHKDVVWLGLSVAEGNRTLYI